MTKAELNRKVKSLKRRYLLNRGMSQIDQEKYDKEQEGIKKEAYNLYKADQEFEDLNRESILILLRLNILLQFENPHLFGSNIEMDQI